MCISTDHVQVVVVGGALFLRPDILVSPSQLIIEVVLYSIESCVLAKLLGLVLLNQRMVILSLLRLRR